MIERRRLGVPDLTSLTPHFAVTVLECRHSDGAAAFLTLRRFLRETLADPGRASAVRLRGERLLTEPDDDADALGVLSDLDVQGMYVLVRERWQRPRWAAGDHELDDLTHELTVALRRHRLVAVHSTVSGALLRRWTRSAASPYRFLPEAVLTEAFPVGSGGVVAVPAWSRLTSPARLDLAGFVPDVVDALDRLAKAMAPAPGLSDLA